PAQALRDHLFDLRRKGFNRLFQQGRVFEFSTPESLLDIDFSNPLFVLADRIAMGPDLHQRLVDTIEICYREAGAAIFESAAGGEQVIFNWSLQWKTCLKELYTPEAVLFRFNSAFRSRPRCQGFGNTIDFVTNPVSADPSL